MEPVVRQQDGRREGKPRASRSKNRDMWARDLRFRVIFLWEDARKNGWTHEEILGRFISIKAHSLTWPKLTAAEQHDIWTVWDTCQAVAYHRDITWRLGPAEGPLPEDSQVWGEGTELSRLARIPGALYGGHFWRGTDKPFGEYKASGV